MDKTIYFILSKQSRMQTALCFQLVVVTPVRARNIQSVFLYPVRAQHFYLLWLRFYPVHAKIKKLLVFNSIRFYRGISLLPPSFVISKRLQRRFQCHFLFVAACSFLSGSIYLYLCRIQTRHQRFLYSGATRARASFFTGCGCTWFVYWFKSWQLFVWHSWVFDFGILKAVRTRPTMYLCKAYSKEVGCGAVGFFLFLGIQNDSAQLNLFGFQ